MDMDARSSIGLGCDPVVLLQATATTERRADAMLAFPAGLSRRDIVYLSMAAARARAEGTAPALVPAFIGQDRAAPTHREIDEIKGAVFELQQQVASLSQHMTSLSQHVASLSQEVAKLVAVQETPKDDRVETVTAMFRAMR